MFLKYLKKYVILLIALVLSGFVLMSGSLSVNKKRAVNNTNEGPAQAALTDIPVPPMLPVSGSTERNELFSATKPQYYMPPPAHLDSFDEWWKVYSDDKYGFEVGYPSHWSVKQFFASNPTSPNRNLLGEVGFIPPYRVAGSDSGVYVEVYDMPLSDFQLEYIQDGINVKRIKINNMNGIFLELERDLISPQAVRYDHEIVFGSDRFTYRFYSVENEYTPQLELGATHSDVLDRVITSFRLLK